ncbi:Protein UmuC [Pleomorphomonas sp. T1.2MG-36]|uniref:Y-family DNA polymerase n=1 Tax=Pleomorphomonas sp. T1.2MG-36 TaxID=3041167 RepID=UPI0024778282|nr:type VI secretion protein ImpB [Pleomorphomonas sp. T1.2MG-36]CAI9400074.1 Protein UmuC [Pleomorphomonas sp. T1.2MG-36]
MRQPETIERLYLDFDGFFASVEQAANRKLRGRPVGVVPYEGGGDRAMLIAVSREAKNAGITSLMSVGEALAKCCDLVTVPQKPDLYRRAHNALLSEIETIIPIDTAKSIDELTCVLAEDGRQHPEDLAWRVKTTIRDHVTPVITSTIGFAANRQLSKMACKAGKRSRGSYGDGMAVWHPKDMPAPLFKVGLDDIPGVGSRLAFRLKGMGIYTAEDLYNLQPKHMRKIWRSVVGERMWYALHGYDIQAPTSQRGMFGHGRVLPPESRTRTGAKDISRLLLTKAARRLRRESYYAGALSLWLSLREGSWFRQLPLPVVHDDQAILSALALLWQAFDSEHPERLSVFRIGVTLLELTPANERQLDFLLADDTRRKCWEAASVAVDALNAKYAGTVVSLGTWKPPKGGNVGGKISYTRVPTSEDFW